MKTWNGLLKKFLHGLEDEAALVYSLEEYVINNAATPRAAGLQQLFPFMLKMCFHDFDMVTRDAVSMWVDERKEEAEEAEEDAAAAAAGEVNVEGGAAGAGGVAGEAQALRLKMFTADVTQQLLSFILAEEESTEEEETDEDGSEDGSEEEEDEE